MKKYTIGQFNEYAPAATDDMSLTVRNYASELNRTMGDIFMIAPSVPKCVDNEDFTVLRYASIPVAKKSSYRMGSPKFDLALQNRLRDIPFDLLHCHSPFAAGRYALRMAHRKGIPVVATFYPEYCRDVLDSVHPVMAKLMTRRMVDFYSAVDEVWVPSPAAAKTLHEYGYKGRSTVMETGNQCQENTIEAVTNRYVAVMQRKKRELQHRKNRVPWPERIWPDPMFELNEQFA